MVTATKNGQSPAVATALSYLTSADGNLLTAEMYLQDAGVFSKEVKSLIRLRKAILKVKGLVTTGGAS